MRRMGRKVLLRHPSGWLIIHEPGFPSNNYCVFKRNETESDEKLPARGVAYCSSLENALFLLFQQLIVENAVNADNYRGSLQDLRKAIEEARKDFHELLKV